MKRQPSPVGCDTNGTVMTIECSRCKTENADGQKFCGNCGGPLDPTISAVKELLTTTLRSQVNDIIEQHYKDQRVVEIETTQAIATRLSDWAKLFAFFVGIPIGLLLLILGALGIKTYTDFSNQVEKAKTDVTTQLTAAQTNAAKLKSEGDSLTTDYQKLHDQFSDIAALGEQLKTLAAKVDVIGEKLGFTSTSKISAEAKSRLQAAFTKFQDYLKSLGYRRTTGSLNIDIREKMEIGAIAYYDPDKRMMVIDSKYITDSAVVYREYMHHVLYSSGMPRDPGSVLVNYYALESGLAWYFPCSFIGSPNPSPSAAGWDLTKKRAFSELRPDVSSAIVDGTEIWGSAFWELRQVLGQNAADKLLFETWFKVQAEETKSERGASFVRKLYEIDKAHEAQIRPIFVQRGLAL
jgi:uncharacterized membrane-anchored protein YhcB (DUF1043 family)